MSVLLSHRITVRDDSDPRSAEASLVVVCACGASFVAWGRNRDADADWQHGYHVFMQSEVEFRTGGNEPMAPPANPEYTDPLYDNDVVCWVRRVLADHPLTPLSVLEAEGMAQGAKRMQVRRAYAEVHGPTRRGRKVA